MFRDTIPEHHCCEPTPLQKLHRSYEETIKITWYGNLSWCTITSTHLGQIWYHGDHTHASQSPCDKWHQCWHILFHERDAFPKPPFHCFLVAFLDVFWNGIKNKLKKSSNNRLKRWECIHAAYIHSCQCYMHACTCEWLWAHLGYIVIKDFTDQCPAHIAVTILVTNQGANTV